MAGISEMTINWNDLLNSYVNTTARMDYNSNYTTRSSYGTSFDPFSADYVWNTYAYDTSKYAHNTSYWKTRNEVQPSAYLIDIKTADTKVDLRTIVLDYDKTILEVLKKDPYIFRGSYRINTDVKWLQNLPKNLSKRTKRFGGDSLSDWFDAFVEKHNIAKKSNISIF